MFCWWYSRVSVFYWDMRRKRCFTVGIKESGFLLVEKEGFMFTECMMGIKCLLVVYRELSVYWCYGRVSSYSIGMGMQLTFYCWCKRRVRVLLVIKERNLCFV